MERPAHKLKRSAAWGIAVDATRINRGVVVFCGPVTGIDQSTRAAELHAAMIALRAANLTNSRCQLVIDNLGVQRAVDGALQGLPWTSKFSFGPMLEIHNMQQLGTRAYWVPSHDKKRDVVLPDNITEAQARAINKEADAGATTAGIVKWHADREVVAAEMDSAASWSRLVLERWTTAEKLFHSATLPPL